MEKWGSRELEIDGDKVHIGQKAQKRTSKGKIDYSNV